MTSSLFILILTFGTIILTLSISITTMKKRKNCGNKTIYKLQGTVLILLFVIVLFSISFPLFINFKSNEILPKIPTKVSNIRLSSIYKNSEVYFINNDYDDKYDYYNSIYVIENNDIKAYTFSNSDRYSSGNYEYYGRARKIDMQEYFGTNFHYGKPKPTDIIPYFLPILIIIPLILLGAIIIICHIIHKSVKDILFKLIKNDALLIEFKKQYDNEEITLTEYTKLKRKYFSKQIMNNSRLMSIFWMLY